MTIETGNRKIAWALVELHIPVIFNTRSFLFYCPDHLSMWRADTLYTKEPETLNWIRTATVDTFLDVGASTGLYSIYAAGIGYRNVYACDNNPEVFTILKKNIELNRMESRIIPIPDLKLLAGNLNEYPALIKIDTDGSEIPILKEYQNLITNAKSIMIEESPWDKKEIQRLLTEYGFTCKGRYASTMMKGTSYRDYRNAVWVRGRGQ